VNSFCVLVQARSVLFRVSAIVLVPGVVSIVPFQMTSSTSIFSVSPSNFEVFAFVVFGASGTGQKCTTWHGYTHQSLQSLLPFPLQLLVPFAAHGSAPFRPFLLSLQTVVLQDRLLDVRRCCELFRAGSL
jgi:hypothetical protein